MGEPAQKAPAPKRRRTQRGLRVLLAEDNAVNQKLESRLLEKLGHKVTVVSDGRAAVSAFESKDFDLLVLDVQMPEMDGLRAASLVRAREGASGSRIPILALTAHAAAEDRDRCLATGMDSYLSKPIRLADLDRAICELVPDGARQTKAGQSKFSRPVATAKAIDERELLAGLGGDRELLADMLRFFVDDSPRLLRELALAVHQSKAAETARTAHALKGSIANVSRGAAYRTCAELEQMAKTENLASTSRALQNLETELDMLVRAAEKLLKKYSPEKSRPRQARKRRSVGAA
jgi:CheY-like chemotaxis protein